MALVRCPKHKIPYNDDNPRGCPACARERKGGGRGSDANLLQELARASQFGRRPSSATSQPADVDGPVTPPPRFPAPRFTAARRLVALVGRKRLLAGGGMAIVLLSIWLIVTTGPTFTPAVNPPVYGGVVRPFPVEPNQPVSLAFSALGPQQAHPHPTTRTLERYSYGTDLVIDAQNGVVYLITIQVPNRSWRGLRIGMNQTAAAGTLALLGAPQQVSAPTVAPPDTIGGFVAYGSLDARPRRVLLAEVRPPNGCYDVLLDFQPRALGVVRRGDRTYAAVARQDQAFAWVLTRIRTVSRAMTGPYAGEAVC